MHTLPRRPDDIGLTWPQADPSSARSSLTLDPAPDGITRTSTTREVTAIPAAVAPARPAAAAAPVVAVPERRPPVPPASVDRPGGPAPRPAPPAAPRQGGGSGKRTKVYGAAPWPSVRDRMKTPKTSLAARLRGLGSRPRVGQTVTPRASMLRAAAAWALVVILSASVGVGGVALLERSDEPSARAAVAAPQVFPGEFEKRVWGTWKLGPVRESMTDALDAARVTGVILSAENLQAIDPVALSNAILATAGRVPVIVKVTTVGLPDDATWAEMIAAFTPVASLFAKEKVYAVSIPAGAGAQATSAAATVFTRAGIAVIVSNPQELTGAITVADLPGVSGQIVAASMVTTAPVTAGVTICQASPTTNGATAITDGCDLIVLPGAQRAVRAAKEMHAGVIAGTLTRARLRAAEKSTATLLAANTSGGPK